MCRFKQNYEIKGPCKFVPKKHESTVYSFNEEKTKGECECWYIVYLCVLHSCIWVIIKIYTHLILYPKKAYNRSKCNICTFYHLISYWTANDQGLHKSSVRTKFQDKISVYSWYMKNPKKYFNIYKYELKEILSVCIVRLKKTNSTCLSCF